jgi:hypothetical protein
MLHEPVAQRWCGAVGEQVNAAPPFQIHQQRAVPTPFAQRKIIDTEDTRGWRGRTRGTAHETQQGVRAAGHVQAVAQTGAGFPAGRKSERFECSG